MGWREYFISSNITPEMVPNLYPKCSMYGIYIYIYEYLPQKKTKVGKYSIHGASGYVQKNVKTSSNIHHGFWGGPLRCFDVSMFQAGYRRERRSTGAAAGRCCCAVRSTPKFPNTGTIK